jgi:hypothetical protein
MAFSPPENPKPGKSLFCEECGHGQSNHPLHDNNGTSTPEASAMAPAMVTSKKRILDIFGARANAPSPSLSTVDCAGNTSIEDARQETLSGFHDKAVLTGKKVCMNLNKVTTQSEKSNTLYSSLSKTRRKSRQQQLPERSRPPSGYRLWCSLPVE